MSCHVFYHILNDLDHKFENHKSAKIQIYGIIIIFFTYFSISTKDIKLIVFGVYLLDLDFKFRTDCAENKKVIHDI